MEALHPLGGLAARDTPHIDGAGAGAGAGTQGADFAHAAAAIKSPCSVLVHETDWLPLLPADMTAGTPELPAGLLWVARVVAAADRLCSFPAARIADRCGLRSALPSLAKLPAHLLGHGGFGVVFHCHARRSELGLPATAPGSFDLFAGAAAAAGGGSGASQLPQAAVKPAAE